MKFFAKDSKLFPQIMEGLVTFFSLDPDTATETDVHAAIDGAEPLAAQLEKAKGSPDATLAAQVETLKADLQKANDELAAAQGKVSDLENQATAKDERIAELQVEVEAATQKMEAQATQYKTEIKTLSGKVATLTAGKTKEIEADDSGNGGVETMKNPKGKDEDVIVVQSTKLNKLLEKSKLN